jgi:preprotein translocase subunit YajC
MKASLMVSFVTFAGTFVSSPVWAQAGGAPAPAAPTGGNAPPAYLNFVPYVILLGAMYWFLMRPQAQRQKTHQSFLMNLKRGEEVLTSGGLLGRIEGLTDLYVTLEIATNVRIKILRAQIASYVPQVTNVATEVKA